MLIVCEGEKTEPNYFNAFRTTGLDVDVVGKGGDPLNVVKVAQRYADKPPNDRLFHEVWCVFDRDETSISPERFNEAIERAKRTGINVAYSNPCFELWYLLHFQPYNTPSSCADCCSKLEKAMRAMRIQYRKNADDMFDLLAGRQAEAIRRAAQLLGQPELPGQEHNNPSTTVHKLVKRLNDYRKR